MKIRLHIILLLLTAITIRGQVKQNSYFLQNNIRKLDSAERRIKLSEIKKELTTTEDNYRYKLAEAAVLNAENKLKDATATYYEAISIAEELKNDSLKGEAFAKLGYMYLSRDNLSKALINLNEAIKYLPEQKTDSNYVNLRLKKALIFSFLDQVQEYKASLQWLLSAATQQPSKILEAYVYNNTGNCFLELNQPDSAIHYFTKSLEIRERIKNVQWIGQSYNNIGTAHFNKSDFPQALKYFQQGLVWRIKGKAAFSGVIESYVNIGKTYNKLQNVSLATTYLNKAYAMADSVKNLPLMQRSAVVLKEIYYGAGEYKKAMQYQDIYYAINDSMYSNRKKEELVNLTLDFETDQKLKHDSIKRVQAEFEVKYEREKKEAISRRTSIIIGLLALFLSVVAFFAYTFFKSNKEKQRQNELITRQHNQLQQKQTEINDSINYAKHIQSALLPSAELFKEKCKEHFIYFLPKDVVSGDFYWATSIKDEKNDLFVYITADCTGHGVPGAFMSLISISFFNEIIDEEKTIDPAEILDKLRKKIIQTLSQKEEGHGQDGLDCVVCVLNNKTKELSYSGANSRLYVAHSGQAKLKEYVTDKMPVGKSPRDSMPFTGNKIQLKENDIIYTFTDGYPDQFGGPSNKKLKVKSVVQKIENIMTNSLCEQEKEIKFFFLNWKSAYEQIDDVTFIAVKV